MIFKNLMTKRSWVLEFLLKSWKVFCILDPNLDIYITYLEVTVVIFRFFKMDICLASELFLIIRVVLSGRSSSFVSGFSVVTKIFLPSKGLRSWKEIPLVGFGGCHMMCGVQWFII